MIDMTPTIQAKSDQLNADDLIGGPITIKITKVSVVDGDKAVLNYEGDNGRPYKPCKTMCRIMTSAWGTDGDSYIGQRLTLYRDPTVIWGGKEVGGIRISHMSGIDTAMSMSLTATRGKKAAYIVEPLEQQPQAMQSNPAPAPMTDQEYEMLEGRLVDAMTPQEITETANLIAAAGPRMDQKQKEAINQTYTANKKRVEELPPPQDDQPKDGIPFA